MLLKGTEDYDLLHATKGRALTRLTVALCNGFEGASGTGEAEACAMLCHAALAVRSRSTCGPLLEHLSSRFGQIAAESGAAALVLVGAAAELHAASMLPAGVLHTLLGRARQAFDKDVPSEHDPASWRRVGEAIRACSRTYLSEPDGTAALFEVLTKALVDADLTSPQGQHMLVVCRGLPGRLRLELSRATLSGKVAGSVGELPPQAIKNWLALLHDLPGFAIGDSAAQTSILAITSKLIGRLLSDCPAEEVTVSTLAWAYLAASGAAQISDDKSFAELANRVLGRMEGRWPELRAKDIQVMFRTPAATDELSSQLTKNFQSLRDVQAQITALRAGAGSAEGVAERLATLRDTKALCSAEAALQRSGVSKKTLGPALVAARQGAFKAVLLAEMGKNRRPPRGFIQYVEEKVRKDRTAEQGAAADAAAEDAASAPAPRPEEMAQPVALVETQPGDESEVAVRRRASGVQWHEGVGGWEVRVEVGGRRVLGGYFRPANGTGVDLENARLDAEKCHERLIRQQRSAPRL